MAALCRQNSVRLQIQAVNAGPRMETCAVKPASMIPFLGFFTCLSIFYYSRYNLSLEVIALRQQLCVLTRRNPHPWLPGDFSIPGTRIQE